MSADTTPLVVANSNFPPFVIFSAPRSSTSGTVIDDTFLSFAVRIVISQDPPASGVVSGAGRTMWNTVSMSMIITLCLSISPSFCSLRTAVTSLCWSSVTSAISGTDIPSVLRRLITPDSTALTALAALVGTGPPRPVVRTTPDAGSCHSLGIFLVPGVTLTCTFAASKLLNSLQTVGGKKSSSIFTRKHTFSSWICPTCMSNS
mmetsp:Transcript_13487/g.29137  ORF Transcript_13487/g.29137 Transcript_13487/m.29137 type:complete len:204 (-) Transcript_13487:976-1587(-)